MCPRHEYGFVWRVNPQVPQISCEFVEPNLFEYISSSVWIYKTEFYLISSEDSGITLYYSVILLK